MEEDSTDPKKPAWLGAVSLRMCRVPDMRRVRVEWFVPCQPCGTRSIEEAEGHSFGQETPTEHLLYAQPMLSPGVTRVRESQSHLQESSVLGGHADMQTDLQRPETRPPQGSTDQQGKPWPWLPTPSSGTVKNVLRPGRPVSALGSSSRPTCDHNQVT